MHLTYRRTCRVCGSDSLTPVINLGEQHLQGSFIKEGKETPPMRKIPCEIVRCNPELDEAACGLLQMKHSVPPEILYAAYWYRSGTNDTMRNHLKGIAETASTLLNKTEATILDIGCNDGTLLKNYPAHFIKYGVDPSDVAQEVEIENTTIVQDIFPSVRLPETLGARKIDVVTSIAMFYD